MKYAVISDVHANLEAVTACLSEIEKLKADRIICLGDMVDYCAEPNKVVSIIRKKCDVVILGNHDEAQYNYRLSERFNERARISSVHTRSILDKDHLEYFKTLKLTHSENNLLFVHSSPCEPRNYSYVLDEEDAEEAFSQFDEQICFIGHSHKPVIFELKENRIKIDAEENLNPSNRYIINVGSVGQPRDGNPELSFGFFDDEKFLYKNIRVSYDTETASQKIKNEKLPDFLAERIISGI